MFSRTKWLPATIFGTSSVRRGARAHLAIKRSSLSALRGGHLGKIRCAVPLCFAIFGDPGLHFALESLLSML